MHVETNELAMFLRLCSQEDCELHAKPISTPLLRPQLAASRFRFRQEAVYSFDAPRPLMDYCVQSDGVERYSTWIKLRLRR